LALIERNTRELIDPVKLKLKILIYGLHGSGKTTFLSTVPGIGIGASETGHGSGLMGVAGEELNYCDINSYEDFDSFCSGAVFKNANAYGLDSLSDVVKTYVKAKALSFPRKQGDSLKRAAGVPEIDDYGSMGELTRKLLRKLIDQPKHIVVTSGLRMDKPDPDNGQTETLFGPDLPGQMFLGSTAMFDLVLVTRTRSILPVKDDAKSRRTEYYIVTNNPGTGLIAKNRLGVKGGVSFLPQEMVFDPVNGKGTFNHILTLAQDAYAKFIEENKNAKAV
jgi:energy-coupling factor transporter ATP-binding protein EcfA2